MYRSLRIRRAVLLAGLLLATFCAAPAQVENPAVNPQLLQKAWTAFWIAPPGVSLKDYGVYHFRKAVDLPARPGRFVVHLTADNRYQLFVNGKYVCRGPARGDVAHWRFETVDLAPYLQAGRNVLAAVVWNYGEHITLSQITYKTGFLLQGDSEAEAAVNTDDSWKVTRNKGFAPIPFGPISFRTYYVAGPGDKLDAAQYPWGWETAHYDDAGWEKPRKLDRGSPHGQQNFANWQLVPRNIPMLEEKPQAFATVRRATGLKADAAFLQGKAPLTVPARTKATLLLDQGVLTTAYPTLTVRGGAGSTVQITYAEALFDENYKKGNRNEVEGRQMIGNYDQFVPDGGDRTFSPLWYRTFRYVQLNVQTGEQPLVIGSFNSLFSAYPFRENAAFAGSDPDLKKIWDVGWRTARLCAYETYMDCPYYEQLQYIGDTRIQALISFYVSGDDRLARNALQQIDQSRTPEGITQSRYPSELPQFIPPFSLLWVAMVHDYWMHRADEKFVQSFLPGIREVLGWWERRVNADGMLGETPYWNFIDHSYPVEKILAQSPNSKTLAANGLSLAYALRHAEPLFRHFGLAAEADRYRDLAGRLTAAVQQTCYDPTRQLFADTPDKKTFSQQVNVLAVLTDAVAPAERAALLGRTLPDTSLTQSTIYFQFYHFRALHQAGLGDQYLSYLQPWRNMVAEGLTTFAEMEKNTRSDCHAWSASPNYDLLSVVCGIVPAKPGFAAVDIAPNLGPLKEVTGRMPHPAGEIAVNLKRKGTTGLTGQVTLPPGLSGTFRWAGREIALKEGTQKINL
jgi:hypothetical protein